MNRRLLLKNNSKHPKWIQPLTIILIIAVFLCCALSNTVRVRSYTISSPLIKDNTEIRVVLISDLHSTIYGKNQEPLIRKIKKQNPDLIVLSGDIFDDDVPDTGTEMILSSVTSLAPVYYVTGNHEYWTWDIQRIKNTLKAYNVRVLSDEYVRINLGDNEIILAGIEDPHKKQYGNPGYDQPGVMANTFRSLDEIAMYKILAAHRPENIDLYRRYSFDLVLSGHTHGGQARIPFLLNGLYAPNQGFFPKYAGGKYDFKDSTLIVSRGLSINPKLPRVFNPPEVVLVVIKPEGN